MAKQKTYIAIDLKSFYASVECKERNRDPLTTNLVVADKSRTEKTICLAVSPSLKSYGIPGRPRLFEVVQKVKEANNTRRWKALNRTFTGSSDDSTELNANPALEIDYIVAPPRMAYYLEYSTKIYSVYLKYIAPEDIFPYSIDEVFIDATNYLNTYQMTARELAMTMIQDVLKTTGITATAGIGTNMYLCKIAMDIVAKHIEPDKDGVRIAELDEMSYRRQLWNHRPLTDFWRVGKGYAKKLEEHGLFTMGDIARCSIGKSNELYNEELLYKLFGINAPNTATITCCHILENGEPILYVSHDEDDGMWQFLCGKAHETDEAKLVSLKSVFDLDNSVGILKDMPCGYYAERKAQDDEWSVRKR